MPADVFLSYSREDQATARRFAEGFEREGFTVWWDQALNPGEAFDRVTEQALDAAKTVVVLWSRHSVDSRWVRAEASQALAGNRLVPVMIEQCRRPIMFELTHTADLSAWAGDTKDPAWRAFVQGLLRFTGGQAALKSASNVSAPAKKPTRAMMQWIAIGSLLLALVAVGAWHFAGGRGVAAPPDFREAVARRTIAVLPFADLSEKKDQEYFSDGVTEEILNSLSRVSNLEVTGRTSSFYFKGRNENLGEIGKKLGVEYLLEGSVRKSGDALRITAQLIKAADGFHLWSQTYDRQLKDIFGVQEEIARSVANALQVALGVGDLGQLPGMTRDVQAYDAWLESRALMVTESSQDANRSIEKLEFAVRRDPTFELAWLELHNRHSIQGLNSGRTDAAVQAARARADTVLAEAVRLNPESRLLRAVMDYQPGISRGEWLKVAGAWDELESLQEKYSRVEAIGPSNIRSQWLIAVDKASEAIARMESDRARNPLDFGVPIFLGEAYANVGRLEDATSEQARGLKLASAEILASTALLTELATGDAGHAERAWQQVLPRSSDALLKSMYELRKRPADARAELRRQYEIQPRVLAASRVALWAGVFGDPELAVAALREDKDLDRRRITAMAMWRPVMAGARRLPEFKLLVREWGLVDYWKQYGWGDHCKPVGADDFQCQ
jgi:TolB-like protein